MIDFEDRLVAFLFVDIAAVLLVGGMLWFTTPFRKRGNAGDKLFFCLVLCVISVILSDTMLILLKLERLYSDIVPFDKYFYYHSCNFFNIGAFYFMPFLMLYACSLLDNGDKIVRIIKIPVLLLHIPYILASDLITFLPGVIRDYFTRFNYIGVVYSYGYMLATLLILCFVERKLMLYYLITFAIWLFLSRFVSILEFTGLLDAQILVFSHIIGSNQSGDFQEKNLKKDMINRKGV